MMKIQEKYQFPLFLLFVVLILVIRGISRLENLEWFLSQVPLSLTIFLAFVLSNENKKWLLASAFSLSLLPLCQLLDFLPNRNIDWVYFTTLVVAVSSGSFYFLRFWSKTNKWSILEILKLLAVWQFAIIHIIDPIEYAVSTMILGITFIFTRLSQNKIDSKMVRVSITGLLLLTTVFFIVYANIKASEAEKQTIQAEINLRNSKKIYTALDKENTRLASLLDSLQNRLDQCQSLSAE